MGVVSRVPPVMNIMHGSLAAGVCDISMGCDNGTSVADEREQTRPDGGGGDDEGVCWRYSMATYGV